MKRAAGLMCILLLIWLSMLLGSRLIGAIIVPLKFNSVFTGTLKVLLTAGLGVSWLWMWRTLAYIYFQRRLKAET